MLQRVADPLSEVLVLIFTRRRKTSPACQLALIWPPRHFFAKFSVRFSRTRSYTGEIMNDDLTLLQEYAARNSEAAFAALVSRHVNLVYSVACRQVGDPLLAEEITQAVFILLARKAGVLGDQVILPGWLCRTARYVGSEALRNQRRRQRREQEAHMQSLLNEPESEAWPHIAPLLDGAMETLDRKDHDALVLRFFEGKNFQEVGAALGANEDTARMRVNRALEKLRKFFTKRGVNSTTEILAGAISAHSVQAAPVALAKSATAVALAKGSAASGSTLTLIKGALKIMAWTKAKTAVIAGAAAILTTGTSIVVVKDVHSASAAHLALRGLPQTLAELDAWYAEPPPGQNAATFNLRGIQARQVNGVAQNPNLPILGKLPPPPLGTPLPPPVKSDLADFLQRNQQAMQFFAQGAQYEQSRYPLDLTQGSETLLPHLQGIKSGMQMSELAAISDAENNDPKQAADDIVQILALARSLDAEPLTISQLVRAAGVALAEAGLQQVVNRTTLAPDSLTALSKAFQAMEVYEARGEGFNRAMTGEKVCHMALLKDRDKLIHDLNLPGFFNLPDDERNRMLQYVAKSDSLKAEQDYLETSFRQIMSARLAAFPDRLNTANLTRKRAANAAGRGLLFNALEWDSMDGMVNREASSLANLRMALTAVAFEQFRAAHAGQYPAKLADLTPNLLHAPLQDPFDGRPLRYQKQGAGYVLYSIGPNLKDHGGRQNGRNGDLHFIVITPPSP
jgi:RNA polymerase sigma factor (sigma-70 family)